jgi:hypothetical protein
MSPLRKGEEGSFMRRADALLGSLIRDLGIQEGIRFAQITKDWHHLFQQPLSYHMFPSHFSQGQLTLNVDSHVWLHELHFHKTAILKKLQAYRVKAVRFRLGRTGSPGQGKSGRGLSDRRKASKVLTPEQISLIEEAISKVEDSELKSTIAAAMKKAFVSGGTKTGLR